MIQDASTAGRQMTAVPAALTDFARRLLLREAGNSPEPDDFAEGLARSCQALRAELAPLLSSAGFDALLARAIKLTARDFAFLIAVANDPICSSGTIREAVEGRDATEAEQAQVAILANFIWLLIIFIGEQLGLRKVRAIWPDIPWNPPAKKAP